MDGLLQSLGLSLERLESLEKEFCYNIYIKNFWSVQYEVLRSQKVYIIFWEFGVRRGRRQYLKQKFNKETNEKLLKDWMNSQPQLKHLPEVSSIYYRQDHTNYVS